MSTKNTELLAIEFCANFAVTSRAVKDGTAALKMVIAKHPAAEVRPSTKKEAQQYWAGARKQHGREPWDPRAPIFMYSIDGFFTPVHNPSNVNVQRRHKGVKGIGYNHIIIADGLGCICYYAIGFIGCTTDARASREAIELFRSPAWNPEGFGLIVDCGWQRKSDLTSWYDVQRAARSGERVVPMVRPLMKGDVILKEELEFEMACSAHVTVLRQRIEQTIGSLRRSFPILSSPSWVGNKERTLDTMELCIGLFNLRARSVGWNQVRTTYLRHSDANFREQLQVAKNADEFHKLQRKRYAYMARVNDE